jgi:hypothetical protein
MGVKQIQYIQIYGHSQFGNASQFRQCSAIALQSFMESLILAQDERWRRA